MNLSISKSSINYNVSLENEIVTNIKEVVNPDMVFVLGVTRNCRSTESIFCCSVNDLEIDTSYLVLVLAKLDPANTIHKFQDRIEKVCESVIEVTCLLLDTDSFLEWLSNGHQFAVAVVSSINPIYKSDSIRLEYNEAGNDDDVSIKEVYEEGLKKGQAFIAGAELYLIRKEYKLSMFMLHQAAEQLLSSILKIGMRYYCCTHNIDRLLKYARFVLPDIDIVFPRKRDTEKRLFTILQKAYIDSRYSSDYIVNYNEVSMVMSKVKKMNEIFEQWGELQQRR